MGIQRRGFTLIELLVVIAIVIILAGLIIPAIWSAYAKSRETKCLNNLQNLHKGMMMYRDDHMHGGRELNPMRLTHLFSMKYVQAERTFICPVDEMEGAQVGKPDGDDPSGTPITQYAELDEPVADPPGVVNGVLPCSYMYECAMGAKAFSGWETILTLPPTADTMGYDRFVDLDGDYTSPNATKWGEVKAAQIRFGDTYINPPPSTRLNGYSPTKFPVLRCFWHTNNPNTNDVNEIINLAYTGNLFRSGSLWELETKIW
jgi:prepilin-type N-terminal cleavage/methylation domain-containing protein